MIHEVTTTQLALALGRTPAARLTIIRAVDAGRIVPPARVAPGRGDRFWHAADASLMVAASSVVPADWVRAYPCGCVPKAKGTFLARPLGWDGALPEHFGNHRCPRPGLKKAVKR